MINAEVSIIVSRPIEEVFAYVSDFRNTAQWQSGIVDVRQTSECPVGKGTGKAACESQKGAAIWILMMRCNNSGVILPGG